MKKILFIFSLCFSTSTFSQSVRLTSDIGFSITKLAKEKRVGLYRGIGLGVEKYFSNNWYLELLPNAYQIQFASSNTTAQNTFTTIRFIELDFEVKNIF